MEDHALLDALTALPPSQVVKPALHLMKHFALAPILLSIVTLPLRILLAILTFITTNVWLKLATALAELLTLEPSLPSLATATLTALTPVLVSPSRELDLLATIVRTFSFFIANVVIASECGDVNADPSWSYDYTCENNVCQKSVKNLPGDSCSSNSDCEFYADFSLGCSSGKCASQQVGSVCPMSDNNVYCGPNLYCDDQDTCRKTIAFGSTCDGNATESARTSMCGNLGACDSDSNTCVRYLSKTKGQACTFEGECADGLYCSKNTSTCQSNLPQIACNSDDDCTKANPDYTGCDCFGGKPMCSAPTSACNSEALALYTCIEDNNCPTDFIPGGCVQNNCKKEHDCYFACYSSYIAQAYGGSGDSCLSNYVNTCDAPSFAAKNSVAWAVVASASAAAILL